MSIIDLAGGTQPIYNEDRSVVVVFNGEIYNYRELRSGLERRGHALATASDTEVIVHLYEEAGDDCVQRAQGHVRLCVVGYATETAVAGSAIGWGSSRSTTRTIADSLSSAPKSKPCCGIRRSRPGPIAEALGHFLSLKYVPAPQTMFDGIHALPPGTLLVCDRTARRSARTGVCPSRNGANGHRSEASYEDELAALLRESVKLHLVSDVPFGAFLSGGIDSSTIVALMSELLNTPVKTFSVGFDGDGAAFSELPYARLVARALRHGPSRGLVGGRDLVEQAEKVVWHLDQPIADPATLANYMVSELARRHVKMVLTGEGGDELFAGYARHAGDKLSPLFRHLPAARSKLRHSRWRPPAAPARPKLALYALCQPDETSRLVNWFPLFSPDMKSALLTDDFKAVLNGSSAAHESLPIVWHAPTPPIR